MLRSIGIPVNVHLERLRKISWLLIAALALGVALRASSIGFGLPYIVHPDEGTTVRLALRMLHTGDLNPNFFHWSSFTLYINALAYFLFFLYGRLTGRFSVPSDVLPLDIQAIATGKVNLVEEFLISRVVNMFAGVAAIIVVYFIGRSLLKKNTAPWIAAFLLAVQPSSVRNSQIIHPDTFVVLFALLASFFAIKILDDPRPRNYILAAIFAGIATGSKYNAAIVCVAILTAHLLRFGWRGLLRKEIYLAALVSLLAFLATTPYAILDFPQFYAIGPLADAAHYSTGHPGAEGDSLRWYAESLWGALGWLLILALAQIVLSFIRRDKNEIVLASFPIVYFIFVSQFTVHFEMTILPIISYLLVFAALFIEGVLMQFRDQVNNRAMVQGLALILLLVSAFPMLRETLENNANLLLPDGRDLARKWIEANLPAGSRVAIESYAPYVNRSKFMVEGFEGMIEHLPKWYEQNGFEYLVFSSGSYGRFYDKAGIYTDFEREYDAFFNQYQQIARFDQNNFQVRVYKIESLGLPANRVAARFGVYGGWVELVGYDLDLSRWMTSQTQQIDLYWRSLVSRREPLTLTVRLMDRNGQEISESHGPLFAPAASSGQWPEGITHSWLGIVVPASALPGTYRIQLQVDAANAGRVPLLSYANQPLSDKLFIGPFKVRELPVSRDEIARSRPVNLSFANLFSLLGSVLSQNQARAGESVRLTLYWRADRQAVEDYTVFIHLLDNRDAMRAQIDAQPRGGNYPTSIWEPGEIVRDDYVLNLPADLAAGDYRISLGLYRYPSLSRLQLFDASGNPLGDQLVLDQVVTVR